MFLMIFSGTLDWQSYKKNITNFQKNFLIQVFPSPSQSRQTHWKRSGIFRDIITITTTYRCSLTGNYGRWNRLLDCSSGSGGGPCGFPVPAKTHWPRSLRYWTGARIRQRTRIGSVACVRYGAWSFLAAGRRTLDEDERHAVVGETARNGRERASEDSSWARGTAPVRYGRHNTSAFFFFYVAARRRRRRRHHRRPTAVDCRRRRRQRHKRLPLT